MGAKKYEQVQQGHNGHEGHAPQAAHGVPDHTDGVEGCLEPCHPLHLDRNDEVDADHSVGVVQGVGEKQGGVDVGGPIDRYGDSVDQVGQNGRQSRQKGAAEVVDGEFRTAPDPLQGLPQPVVEQAGEQQPDAAAGGQEHVGNDPPDLPVEHSRGAHGQEAQAALGEEVQEVGDDVGAYNIAHQARDRQPGVQGAEAVNGVAQLSQGKIPPVLLMS